MGHDIPVLMVRGRTLAEAWEKSLIALHREGCDFKTEYDKPDDPPSKDASMTIVVEEPLAEPMIHRDFPGGFEDLEEYSMEVCEGIKNHLVRDPNDPDDTRWEYTYNERLTTYRAAEQSFDQLDFIVEKLAKTPHTRRAQAITWKVWEDLTCYDPPCLQSIWCRLLEENGVWWLNTNVRFRSNDAYKAAFMNMFALIRLQTRLAGRIAELSGREVRLARYVHQADSYHIYGSYFREFEQRFLRSLENRTFAERVFAYEDVKEIMDEARPGILAKVEAMNG